jgi:FdhD protein
LDERIVTERVVYKYDGETIEELSDTMAVEFPLTIKLNGEEFATMVCTPSDMEDLVIGFLASEAVIRSAGEIESLTVDPDKGFAYVELRNKLPMNRDTYSKRFIGSCCGKSRQFYFHNDVKTAKTIQTQSGVQVRAEQCIRLMRKLQDASPHFRQTGGVHNAALCTVDDLLLSRTDIGRHNALDKIFGHMLRNNISSRDKIIVFSGRISSEVLLKTAKIGASILLSKSAPTDLALSLAEELGITAAGFVRNGQMNIYTHPHRIVL